MKNEIDLYNYKFEADFPFSREVNLFIQELKEYMEKYKIDSDQKAFGITKRFISLTFKYKDSDSDEKKAKVIKEIMDLRIPYFLAHSYEETIRGLKLFLSPYEKYNIEQEGLSPRLSEFKDKKNYEVGIAYLMSSMLRQRLILALEARTKYISKLGGMAAAKRWDVAKSLAIEIAKERWNNPDSSTEKIGDVANSILTLIKADPTNLGLHGAPTVQAVKKWIADYAPEEARKPGRPKKNI